jgi:hypothetical protein
VLSELLICEIKGRKITTLNTLRKIWASHSLFLLWCGEERIQPNRNVDRKRRRFLLGWLFKGWYER